MKKLIDKWIALREWALEWSIAWRALRRQKNRAECAEKELLVQRCNAAELRADLAAAQRSIESFKTAQHDPLPEAQKLLRLADEIMQSLVCGSEINLYEVRSWRDDFNQYEQRKNASG